jgi:hypothetical protein
MTLFVDNGIPAKETGDEILQAQQDASAAQSTANTALSNAATAQSTANSAQSAAAAAQADADTALLGRVSAEKNGAGTTTIEPVVNFIEGNNVVLAVAASGGKINVTIHATMAVSNSIPIVESATGLAGSSSLVSRWDHQHPARSPVWEYMWWSNAASDVDNTISGGAYIFGPKLGVMLANNSALGLPGGSPPTGQYTTNAGNFSRVSYGIAVPTGSVIRQHSLTHWSGGSRMMYGFNYFAIFETANSNWRVTAMNTVNRTVEGLNSGGDPITALAILIGS